MRRNRGKERGMKIRCKEDLYWKQSPGYDGFLGTDSRKDPDLLNQVVAHVFVKGREYEVIPAPVYETNGLERITLFAVGEDGRWHRILEDELHRGTTHMAVGCFGFERVLEGYKSPRREVGEIKMVAAEINACCPDC